MAQAPESAAVDVRIQPGEGLIGQHDEPTVASVQQSVGNVPTAEPEIAAGTRLLYALPVAVLLRECLQTVLLVTGGSSRGDIAVYSIAICLMLLLHALPVTLAFRLLGQAVVALGAIGLTVYGAVFPDIAWLKLFAATAMEDGRALMAGLWVDISVESRTLLFLVGWATLGGVLLRLAEFTRALWLGAAVLALLLLAQAGGLDTSAAMLRTSAAALLFAVLQHRTVLGEAYAAAVAASGARLRLPPLGGLLPALLLVAACLATGSGVAASQPRQAAAPDWAQLGEAFAARYSGLLAQLAAWTGSSDADAAATRPPAAKTGYSRDDSRLGGPVAADDTIAFTAITPRLTYWRGESKSVYTGRGWATAESPGSRSSRTLHTATGDKLSFLPDSAEDEWLSSSAAGADPARVTGSDSRELLLQTIRPAALRSDRLFAGGEVAAIDSVTDRRGGPYALGSIRYDRAGDALRLTGSDGPPGSYRIAVYAEDFPPAVLTAAGTAYPSAIAEGELKLPDTLPVRVRELAAAITAEAVTPYAKATAIQAYLQAHYTYSMEDAELPPEGMDFVDHFLFESKRGYCDYFSTAMTVLLRVTGVPARWVKGFAPGESVVGEGGLQVTVRNADAHSWVEVYYPGAGWVPVDPTPPQAGASLAAGGQAAPSTREQLSGGATDALFAKLAARLTHAVAVLRDQSVAFLAWLNLAGARQAASAAFAKAAAPHGRMALAAAGAWLAQRLLLYRLLRLRQPGASRSDYALSRVWRRIYRRFGRPAPAETLREYCGSLRLSDPKAQEALSELAQLTEQYHYSPLSISRLTPARVMGLGRIIRQAVRQREAHQAAGTAEESLPL